eukprot:6186849-Pleurochrysis_carterae.AAC.4
MSHARALLCLRRFAFAAVPSPLRLERCAFTASDCLRNALAALHAGCSTVEWGEADAACACTQHQEVAAARSLRAARCSKARARAHRALDVQRKVRAATGNRAGCSHARGVSALPPPAGAECADNDRHLLCTPKLTCDRVAVPLFYLHERCRLGAARMDGPPECRCTSHPKL